VIDEIIAWITDFLSSLTNSLTVPSGIPVVMLVVGTVLVLFLIYVLAKNALFALLVLAALGAVWFFFAPLNAIPIAFGLTALDVLLILVLVGGAWLYTRKKGGR